jgi:hypothetical protein
MLLLPFILVYLLQVSLTFPNFYRRCTHLSVPSVLLYFAHHLVDVFLFWSFLFLTSRAEFTLHFVLVLIVAAHWFTYNNRCIATVTMNRMCGFPEGDWLDSLKNRLGLRNLSEHFHFIWVGLLIVQDLYHMLR